MEEERKIKIFKIQNYLVITKFKGSASSARLKKKYQIKSLLLRNQI
jgi:hypothetical protein